MEQYKKGAILELAQIITYQDKSTREIDKGTWRITGQYELSNGVKALKMVSVGTQKRHLHEVYFQYDTEDQTIAKWKEYSNYHRSDIIQQYRLKIIEGVKL